MGEVAEGESDEADDVVDGVPTLSSGSDSTDGLWGKKKKSKEIKTFSVDKLNKFRQKHIRVDGLALVKIMNHEPGETIAYNIKSTIPDFSLTQLSKNYRVTISEWDDDLQEYQPGGYTKNIILDGESLSFSIPVNDFKRDSVQKYRMRLTYENSYLGIPLHLGYQDVVLSPKAVEHTSELLNSSAAAEVVVSSEIDDKATSLRPGSAKEKTSVGAVSQVSREVPDKLRGIIDTFPDDPQKWVAVSGVYPGELVVSEQAAAYLGWVKGHYQEEMKNLVLKIVVVPSKGKKKWVHYSSDYLQLTEAQYRDLKEELDSRGWTQVAPNLLEDSKKWGEEGNPRENKRKKILKEGFKYGLAHMRQMKPSTPDLPDLILNTDSTNGNMAYDLSLFSGEEAPTSIFIEAFRPGYGFEADIDSNSWTEQSLLEKEGQLYSPLGLAELPITKSWLYRITLLGANGAMHRGLVLDLGVGSLKHVNVFLFGSGKKTYYHNKLLQMADDKAAIRGSVQERASICVYPNPELADGDDKAVVHTTAKRDIAAAEHVIVISERALKSLSAGFFDKVETSVFRGSSSNLYAGDFRSLRKNRGFDTHYDDSEYDKRVDDTGMDRTSYRHKEVIKY